MEELAKRKQIRLKNYDYSQCGVYFITTNVRGNRCVLSEVRVGRGLAPAALRLTELGRIVEQELLDLPRRYPEVEINKYVIMPNHVHAIIFLRETEGAGRRPTLMQVVGTLKSLTARKCNQVSGTQGEKFWQDSFYESILETETIYLDAWNYIDENPIKWAEDKYFVR